MALAVGGRAVSGEWVATPRTGATQPRPRCGVETRAAAALACDVGAVSGRGRRALAQWLGRRAGPEGGAPGSLVLCLFGNTRPRLVRAGAHAKSGRRPSTASTVSSAAIVMVAVFGIFAILSSIIFKQIGVGLAVAILIDATIVRGILLPASMKLLGERNWYLPKKLGWLPKLHHEPEVVPAAA